jgi:hypothetical protein
MIKAYLLFNAAAYIGFALWCTFAPEKTASAIGLQFRSGSGKSEYITVYGGLEMGVAAFFLIAGLMPKYQEAGLLFGLLFYAGLVIFRAYSFATVPGIERMTYYFAASELVLGLIAAGLWFSRTGARS